MSPSIRSFLLIISIAVFQVPTACSAQKTLFDGQEKFSQADRLRGSITAQRKWWDLQHYDLSVEVFPETRSIQGSNLISFKAIEAGQEMQIDLQQPLAITSVKQDFAGEGGGGEKELKFRRGDKEQPNVYWITFDKEIQAGSKASIRVFYEGQPLVAKKPPWSGGVSWLTDDKGDPFITTTCQGIGASVWWPCKDHGYDEPDQGMAIRITVPDSLVAVSNGRLKNTSHDVEAKTKTFHWEVVNPINNYGVNMNIGNYVSFSEKFEGEGGELDVEYWVLDHQRETAKKHFKEVPRTLKAFEHWFGKYPFYEDSYKLVVVPYPGMEHQSSVTYGNGFRNGYVGKDLSGTGVGLKFDFIIVHESGHEWFGNNISMKDSADMWIHESFTNYSENLFVEYHFSKQEAEDYVIGCRKLVKNDRPIIGVYNVNRAGSGDMYYKGGNMLHTIRHIINDDKKWRSMLRKMNKKYWHQCVDSAEVESFLSQESGIDLSKLFDQYLRGVKIPKLNYRIDGAVVEYAFADVVEGFSIPVKVLIDDQEVWLKPSVAPQTLTRAKEINSFEVDRNFYIDVSQQQDPLEATP